MYTTTVIIITGLTTLSLSLKPVRQATTPSIVNEYNGLLLSNRGYMRKGILVTSFTYMYFK